MSKKVSLHYNTSMETISKENTKLCSTWACSQYLTEPFNMPSVKMAKSTIRQVIHTSIGGNCLRLKLSNRCGNKKLVINSVHIAKSAGQGTGTIIPSTDKTLFFNGKENVKIAKGKELYSDFLDFSFNPLDELTISIYYKKVPKKVTGHPGSRTFTYFESGDCTTKETFSHENKTAHWYTIADLELKTDISKNSIVCFGDSITDGRGSTDDKQNRWTDNFSIRMQNNPFTNNFAVINQGIGGTCITNNGAERIERDVFSQAGISHIILFYGVNDIIYLNITAEKLIQCYKDFIKRAHEKNIKIFGCTILPFGKNECYTEDRNKVRLEVNNWILNTNSNDGGFDASFDFASATKDVNNENCLAAENDCGDGLHPSAHGYTVIANAIDLMAFKN